MPLRSSVRLRPSPWLKPGLLLHLEPAVKTGLTTLPSPAVLVVNDSRVIPARLRGRNPGTGGAFELLLLGEVGPNDWWAMVRPGRRAPIGRTIQLVGPGGADSPVTATVTETNDEGHRRLRFDGTNNLLADLESLGEMPLPPYITRPAGSRDPQDRRRYQTVYAGAPGSVAAPTAGLHFTEALLGRVRARGIRIAPVTLLHLYNTAMKEAGEEPAPRKKRKPARRRKPRRDEDDEEEAPRKSMCSIS